MARLGIKISAYNQKFVFALTISLLSPIVLSDFHPKASAQLIDESTEQTTRFIVRVPGAGSTTSDITVGDNHVIEAPTERFGQPFSHWVGDVRVLSDPTEPRQTIRVRRARGTIRLTAVYAAEGVDTVVVFVQGQNPKSARPGEDVTIAAPERAGLTFSRWAGATRFLDNTIEPVQTFSAPDQNIHLRPVYAVSSANSGANNAQPNSNGRTNQAGRNTPRAGSGASQEGSGTFSQTGDVTVVSHQEGNPLRRQGDTIIGRVENPFDGMVVTSNIGDRETSSDVNPDTGLFVVRLGQDELQGNSASVSFTSVDQNGNELSGTFTAPVATDTSGLAKVLSRVAYGPTPSMHAFFSSGDVNEKLRRYIDEQLNPSGEPDVDIDELQIDNFISRDYADGDFNHGGDKVYYRLGYAIYSKYQLREVMTEFWDNHFYKTEHDPRTDALEVRRFRENAFGNFRDLLDISAKSPSMMRYLANVFNQRNNINENYGRELMELHTLGQTAGYGAEDVIQVARIFTGWAARRIIDLEPNNTTALRQEHRFNFESFAHDTEDKFIPFFNVTIEGRQGDAGIEEGEELLDILAMHPSTQRFVCGKMVSRFVADEPPAKYIEACAAAWEETQGNMGAALSAILKHPDYLTDVQNERTKAKTPFEYQASLMRAFAVYPAETPVSLNARGNHFFRDMKRTLEEAGYSTRLGAPDGNPEEAAAWVSTGTILQSVRGTLRNLAPFFQNGVLVSDNDTDIDFELFVQNAPVKTVEGIADYLLDIATAGSHNSNDLDNVANAIRGGETSINLDDPTSNEAAVRRAMTIIATLPNMFIQ